MKNLQTAIHNAVAMQATKDTLLLKIKYFTYGLHSLHWKIIDCLMFTTPFHHIFKYYNFRFSGAVTKLMYVFLLLCIVYQGHKAETFNRHSYCYCFKHFCSAMYNGTLPSRWMCHRWETTHCGWSISLSLIVSLLVLCRSTYTVSRRSTHTGTGKPPVQFGDNELHQSWQTEFVLTGRWRWLHVCSCCQSIHFMQRQHILLCISSLMFELALIYHCDLKSFRKILLCNFRYWCVFWFWLNGRGQSLFMRWGVGNHVVRPQA